MNMFKKNGGFTLVELIVVIAILAILAAVAVPAYSGYISKANAVQSDIDEAAQERAFAAACAYENLDPADYEWTFDAEDGFATKTGATTTIPADVITLANEFMGIGG